MVRKRTLNVAGIKVLARQEKPRCELDSSGTCGSHILAGFGDKDFRFPSVETLVIAALTRLSTGEIAMADSADDLTQPKKRRGGKQPAIHVDLTKVAVDSEPAQPQSESAGEDTDGILDTAGLGTTLFSAAEGLRQVFFKGRFDAIVAERFDPLAGAVNWASQNMDQRYQFAIASLAEQLSQLRSLYTRALPRVLTVLVAQNEGVSPFKLLSAAVGSLDKELFQILYVLRAWTDAFAQLRDGMYTQLQAITFMMEQCFKLFQAGDLDGCAIGKACKRPQLDTKVFHTGNVFLARFTNTGPSTLPGAKGPNGAHVLNVQHAHKNATALMLAPNCHEFRHDVAADIRGQLEELTLKCINAVVAEYKAGDLVFTQDKITFGKNRIPTIEVICQLIADTIGEIDADISGGLLLVGPAFVYNLIILFCALNAGGQNILDVGEGEQLLSAESTYEMDETEEGNPRPRAEEHLPDYIRAYFDAAALDEIGFHKQADHCRALADQAVGLPIPQFITWVHEPAEGEKQKAPLKVAMEDLKRVAPIIARTLIRAKLTSLGGLATCDLINWNENRQRKVDLLVASLLAGSADVPTDEGDFLPTYVAAAATMAYWELINSGRKRVNPALKMVEKNSLIMLDTIRQRLSQPAVAPSQVDCGCPDKTN